MYGTKKAGMVTFIVLLFLALTAAPKIGAATVNVDCNKGGPHPSLHLRTAAHRGNHHPAGFIPFPALWHIDFVASKLPQTEEGWRHSQPQVYDNSTELV